MGIAKKIILVAFIQALFLTKIFACAFDILPPFGADWYHPTIYQMLVNRSMDRSFGLLSNQQHFWSVYMVHPPEIGAQPYAQPITETIDQNYFYYQFRLTSNLQCLVSYDEVKMHSDAISDDGSLVGMPSSSVNQLGLAIAYTTPAFKYHNWTANLQATAGFHTNGMAKNTFHAEVAWLRDYWCKVSPHLIAGSDQSSFTGSLGGVVQNSHLRIYSAASMRMFTPNADGFHFGRDVDAFTRVAYQANLFKKLLSIEPQAGIDFQHGKQDSQKSYTGKDQLVYAQGSVLFATGGVHVRVKDIAAGVNYSRPLLTSSYTEFQLFNKPGWQLSLQYNF